MPTQFDYGFLAGLLVGEGHFGGDGRQPHVTLRMHVRHEAMFRWLERTFPGGRVYGPYHHGGRNYLQWMARGPFLRDELIPVLDRYLSPEVDQHSFERYQQMKANYPELTSTAAAPEPAAPDHVKPAPPPAPARQNPPHRSPARAAAVLDDLFSELRETWPSP